MIILGFAVLVIAMAWVIWGADVISRSRVKKLKLKEVVSPYVNEPFSPLPESWNYEKAAISVATVLTCAYLFFGFISVKSTWRPEHTVSSTINFAFFAFALIYIFVLAKHTFKQLLVIVGVLGFFAAVAAASSITGRPFLGSQAQQFMILFSVMLLIHDITPRKMIKYWFFLMLAAIAITVILSLTGVIESSDITSVQSRGYESLFLSKRYSLGFTHPNNAGIIFAQLLAVYIVVRQGKPKWFDFAFFALVAATLVIVIDSRGGELFLLVFIAAWAFFGKLRSAMNFAPLKWLCILLPEIFGGLSIFSAYCFNPESAIWRRLNGISTGRIRFLNLVSRYLRVTVLGQDTQIQGYKPIDNTYAYIFFAYGIIVTILILLLYSLLIKRLWELKAVKEIALVLAIITYYLVEGAFLDHFNTSLWLMSSIFLLEPTAQQQLLTEKTLTDQ